LWGCVWGVVLWGFLLTQECSGEEIVAQLRDNEKKKRTIRKKGCDIMERKEGKGGYH